jgi:ketosteroid isomerase-like protein
MSLEDKMNILEVIARYAYTYDGRDADGFAQLFTEDGIFEVLPSGGSQPELRLESRAAIHAWVVQRHQQVVQEIQDRHYQSGTLFDVLTQEHAQTRTMVLITHQGGHDPTPRPVLSGVYHDRWQKTQRGWQLTQRTLRHDHQKPYLSP